MLSKTVCNLYLIQYKCTSYAENVHSISYNYETHCENSINSNFNKINTTVVRNKMLPSLGYRRKDSSVSGKTSEGNSSWMSLNQINDELTNPQKSVCFDYHKKGIRVAFLNIHYFMPKIEEIRYHLSQSNRPDVFGFCETFLTENVSDHELNIQNYVFERKDRSDKYGGGIIIYIAEKVPYKRRRDLETNDIESVWIEFVYPNTKAFLINCLYRPPSALQSWIDKYELQLDIVDTKKGEYYILGDLNINFNAEKTRNKYNNTKWSNLISKFGLKQHIQTPTRVTKTSSTVIDHL